MQATASVPELLAAVRRRLWLACALDALRLALWLGAVALLSVVLAHALWRSISPQAVAVVLLAIAGACLGPAAWRRPDDPACALWADRHLHGENAFSTWLQLQRDLPHRADARAVQWLQEWVAARVATARARLAQQAWPGRLGRPALTLVLSAGLCSLVLLLVDRPLTEAASATAEATASVGPAAASGSTQVSAPATHPLADELERRLRAPAGDDPAARASQGTGTGAASPGGQVDATAAATEPGAAPAARPGDHPTAASEQAASNPGASPRVDLAASRSAAGPGTGQGAGDRVDGAGQGAARSPPRGTAGTVQGIDIAPGRGTPQRRADMARGGTYDETSQGLPGSSSGASPAALPARAPAAAPDAPMTPVETHYVQAWMKAITRQSR
jgi:hypothetical protein